MEMMDAFPWLRGVVVGAIALGAVAILMNKERDVHRTTRARALGVVSVLTAALTLAFVGWRVIAPPPAAAAFDLGVGAPAFTAQVTPAEGTELLVHGKLGADGRGQGEGRYTVVVRGAAGAPLTLTGKLSHKVQTRKFMRRGRTNIDVAHLEGRHLLPAALHGGPVTVEVTKLDGELVGPLHLELVPAPPAELPILIAGVALSLLGALLDKSTKAAKTWLGLGIAMLFAFALLLLEAPHPLTVSHLVRSVPVAAVTGGLIGGVLRFAAGLVMKARRSPPATA